MDRPFTLVARGKIEIDVGPLAALLAEEALEEHVHADRIHGGDAERVAHRAVGGRAAPLDENSLLAAKAHDVPHDEEVALEFELPDQCQLALDLAAGALAEIARAAAVARLVALLGALAQKRHHGLAVGHRVARKLVAEIVKRELEARGEFDGVGERVG